MKKLITLFLIGSSFAFGQSLSFKHITEAKALNFNSRTNAPSFITLKKDKELPYTQFDSWIRQALKMSSIDALLLTNTEPDFIGDIHYRYQQMFAGTPVEGNIYIAHTRNGKVFSANGDFDVNIHLQNTVAITKELALTFAVKAIGAKKYYWELAGAEEEMKKQLDDPDFSYGHKGTLVILPVGEGVERKFYYAYKFDIWASEPESRSDVYVDAATGRVLANISTICSGDIPGVANTKYSGLRIITTDSVPRKDTIPYYFRLKETNRDKVGFQIETRNLLQGSNPNASTEFRDSDNYWNNVNAKHDEAATDAHWGAEKTYDFYKKYLGRNSWNNSGGKLNIYVHWQQATINAQWNGAYAQFGDGLGEPLTSIDVVGHEITHGVTGSSARLAYQLESGALNESFSDVMGKAIEWFTDSLNFSWTIGRSSFRLRDMSNPNRFQNPDTYGPRSKFWTDTRNCTPNGTSNDYCGVHNNSGVQNYWFYLLSHGTTAPNGHDTTYVNDLDSVFNVKGIGIYKAMKIAYQNLTHYLSTNSNYNDAYYNSIQAAIELYGENSNEVIQTTNAWFGVGLGKRYSTIPVVDFTVKQLVCEANGSVQFVNNSGSATSYYWRFGDGEESDERNPSHEYAQDGTYTVTLICMNENGKDSLVKKNFIDIHSNDPLEAACIPTTSSATSRYGILRMQFANIDFSSDDAKFEGGFKDFTCARALVAPGGTYTMTLTTDSKLKVYGRAWIDFNNDGSFSSEEMVLKTDTFFKYQTADVTIPTTAVQDVPLRIRVSSSKAVGNTPDDPCATMKYGQYEEYSMLINPKYVGVEKNRDQNYFALYPNPASESFHIKYGFQGSKTISYSIVNLLGQEIAVGISQANGIFEKTIGTEDFRKGLYYVRIFDGEKNSCQPLVIE